MMETFFCVMGYETSYPGWEQALFSVIMGVKDAEGMTGYYGRNQLGFQ